VSSGLEIQWPNTFKNFVLLFNVVNMDFLFSNVTSAECLFSADYYYDRFLLIVIAPVGLLVATALFLLLPRYFEVACFRHTTVQERARQTMSFWKLSLYGLFLIYPSVSSTVLRHFVCKQIDDNSYLWTDLRVQCYTDRWTTYAFVSFGLILIYPVGIPVFFFALLKVNQKDLKEPRIKAQLGFLYAGYRLEVWWWEIVDCGQTPDDTRANCSAGWHLLQDLEAHIVVFVPRPFLCLFCPLSAQACTDFDDRLRYSGRSVAARYGDLYAVHFRCPSFQSLPPCRVDPLWPVLGLSLRLVDQSRAALLRSSSVTADATGHIGPLIN
jgi:hypothetical protein